MNARRLQQLRSDLRRVVSARRRALAAVSAALAVGVGITAARPSPPPTTQVVVAARDLAGGAIVGPDDVRTVAWPAGAVPSGALVDATGAQGATLAGPMRSGEPVTDARVLGPGLLGGYPAGSVLTTLRVAEPVTGTVIHVGDSVDVVAADPQARTEATILARAVRVVAVPPAPDGTTVTDGIVVVVAVDEATALRLADAAVRSQLSLLLTALAATQR